MKTKLFLMFLVFLMITSVSFAQVKIKKSKLAAREPGFLHAFSQSALNTKTGQTLVVWERYASSTDCQVLGRLLNSKGTANKDTFTFFDTLGANPSVTYNPVLDEFLLAYDDNPVWDDNRTSNLFVQRLNRSGQNIGQPINVTGGLTVKPNYFSRVLFNPVTQGYFVVWIRDAKLVGALLTSQGSLSGPVEDLSTSYREPVALGYVSSSSKVFVLAWWFDADSGGNLDSKASYYLAALDPELKNAKPNSFKKVNEKDITRGRSRFYWASSLAVLPGDTGVIVSYADSSSVKTRRFDINGKPKGHSFAAFEGSLRGAQLLNPTVSFWTNQEESVGLLVAVQDDDPTGSPNGESTSWGQFINATGKPAGSPFFIETTSLTETFIRCRLAALRGKTADTSARFIYLTGVPEVIQGDFANEELQKLTLEVPLQEP